VCNHLERDEIPDSENSTDYNSGLLQCDIM